MDQAWHEQVAMREQWEAEQESQAEFLAWLDDIFTKFNEQEQEDEMVR